MNASSALKHPAFHPLPSSFIPLPSDAECAWLAGFIDGEGTISLSVSRRTSCVRPYLSVTNTNLDNIGRARVLLRALIDHDLRPLPRRSKHRPGFLLTATRHKDIHVVLKAIRPWLVGKRPQADLMLEYLDVCSDVLRRKIPGEVRDRTSVRELRQDYARRMRELNRRYGPGEWTALHADDEIDPATIKSNWKAGIRAEFLGDDWEAMRALLALRCG